MVYRLEKCENISCTPRAGDLIDLTNISTAEGEGEKAGKKGKNKTEEKARSKYLRVFYS